MEHFDLIVGMDEQNIRGLKQLASTPEQMSKILRMTDFCLKNDASHVPDPYYGGDQGFEHVIDLLEDACEGFYKAISGK